jgi:HTH-type transcriptional regulator / antitoxin HipB
VRPLGRTLATIPPVEQTKTSSALGTAIRIRRRLLGLSQDDLALSIGVNRKVIGQLEGGKETVQLGIALRAARALGLDVGVEARGEARA